MKTVRFAEVIGAAGTPEVHLLLRELSHDPVLRKAVKSHGVMTLHQTAVGNMADFGTVGFVEGVTGQVLVFPKTLRAFDGKNVVGINYELLRTAASGSNAEERKPTRSSPARARSKPEVSKKIVPFPVKQVDQDVKNENVKIDGIKKLIRRALKALADGKQVVAYHLLETILKP